ncbi:MAG: hypothetical protein R3B51_02865 [Thermodesulfobacteriota bacterium]
MRLPSTKMAEHGDLELHFKEPHFLKFAETFPGLIDGSESIIAYEVSEEKNLA